MPAFCGSMSPRNHWNPHKFAEDFGGRCFPTLFPWFSEQVRHGWYRSRVSHDSSRPRNFNSMQSGPGRLQFKAVKNWHGSAAPGPPEEVLLDWVLPWKKVASIQHSYGKSPWIYPYVFICLSGWWFQTFLFFHNIWDYRSERLIFFKMVKTTNSLYYI